MATTPWSTFYPYIQPHLPGCPEIVMEASLQEASAKFLERSEIWRFEIERDFAVKNVADYPIFIPTKEAGFRKHIRTCVGWAADESCLRQAHRPNTVYC